MESSFINATVNATSLQASCGLLSNLSFYNTSSSQLPALNFSVDGLGQVSFALATGGSMNSSVELVANYISSDFINNHSKCNKSSC